GCLGEDGQSRVAGNHQHSRRTGGSDGPPGSPVRPVVGLWCERRSPEDHYVAKRVIGPPGSPVKNPVARHTSTCQAVGKVTSIKPCRTQPDPAKRAESNKAGGPPSFVEPDTGRLAGRHRAEVGTLGPLEHVP